MTEQEAMLTFWFIFMLKGNSFKAIVDSKPNKSIDLLHRKAKLYGVNSAVQVNAIMQPAT